MEITEVVRITKNEAENFSNDFGDLLAALNPDRLREYMEGCLSTSKNGTEPARYADYGKWLLDALDRGILTLEFSSQLAQEDLERLRAAVSGVPEGEELESSVPAADPIQECASDYRTLDTRSFKARWMGQRRDVYEAAIEQGLI